ncbi:MAG: hypothetical protein IPG50_29835 [Myxococcales bacterium]|nr:hypothetical protein [Myxococcales bacterium]
MDAQLQNHASSLLRFGDRLSMAHSREVRLPFCDHRLTEFAFAVSPDLLVGEGEVKRVLRLAAQGLVPQEILARRKQGFVPPQTKWLLGPLKGFIQDLLQPGAGLEDFMDLNLARGLTAASAEERAREINLLWDTANLAAWAHFAYQPMKRQQKVAPQAQSS